MKDVSDGVDETTYVNGLAALDRLVAALLEERRRAEAAKALAAELREALAAAMDLLVSEGYDTDPDYRQEWTTIADAAARAASSEATRN